MKIKRKTLKRLLFFIVVSTVVVASAYMYRMYITSDWFIIRSYVIKGVSSQDITTLLPKISNANNGFTLFFFPENRILSFSSQKIRSVIQEQIPSVKKIVVYPEHHDTLSITIEEHIPVMRLGTTTAITKDGEIFTTFRDITSIPVLVKQQGEFSFNNNKIDDFDSVYFKDMLFLLEKITTVLFPIGVIELHEAGDIFLIAKDNRTTIRINKKSDLDKLWTTLLSAIDTEPLKTKLAQQEPLDYIDLRFGNKVFYMFTKEVFQNASSTVIMDDHVTEPSSTDATE